MTTFTTADLEAVQRFYQYLENVELPDEFEESMRWMMDNLYGLSGKVDPAAIEHEKEAGLADACEHDFLYAVVDQRHLIEGRAKKWYDPNTTLGDRSGQTRRTKKKRVTFHHTAVENGFGAWSAIVKSLVKEHAKILAAGGDPYELDGNSGLWLVRPNEALTPEQWARTLALGCRYRGEPSQDYNRGIPYHAVHGPNSVLYLNLPLEFVTWHGHGANNDGAGFAWDADSRKQPIPDALAQDLVYDVERFVEIGRSEGHPLDEFEIHAQYANKKTDPGKDYIEKVILPAASSTSSTVRMTFKASKPGTVSIEEVLNAA